MSSTFPLPLECLQLIIRHLLSQADQKSVAMLLCVNKYVCAATLPILYSDPFDMPPLPAHIADFIKEDEKILLAVTRLIRVLLRSQPPASTVDHDGQNLLTELLRGMYFPHSQYQQQDWEAPPLDTAQQENLPVPEAAITTTTTPLPLPPTFLPYASYITKITFEDFDYDHERFCFTLGGYENQQNFQDFLNRTGRVDQYRAEEPRPHYLWNNGGEKEFMKNTVERHIRRDLTWAMCYSNAEQIQTLHLPLSDVGRYLTLISRFKILSEVTFHLDRALSVPLKLNERMTPKEEEVLANLKEDRSRNLEQMILFVQEHHRHHPHVIRTARCSNSRLIFAEHCPKEYHIRLLQSLPPLVRPLFLHDHNWDQFASHISETDLAHVRTLCSRYDPVLTKRLDSLLKQDPFLNRCRSLQDISFGSSSEDMFQWAVKERKDFDGAGPRNGAFRRPLVPLQSYHVLFDNPSSGRQASDVVYAFGETLKSIEITFGGGIPLANDSSQYLPQFSLGTCVDDLEDVNGDGGIGTSSWLESSRLHLPRLESISVKARYRYLRLHPAFLALSPRLKFVHLEDNCSQYSLANVVHWEPAELPHLDHLFLHGTSVASFHPDTFKSTKNLVRIDMYTYILSRDGRSFISNPEGFEQQESENDSNNDSRMSPALPRFRPPIWTWDWDLPSLTTLNLHGEIAYRFQFRMLAGTPNLTYFSINITVITGFQQRTVRIADLLKPSFRHPALADFLERDQQLHEIRQRLIDYSAEDGEACQQQQREEDADKGGDERLWSEGFEFVHVPKLKKLLLDGQWIMDYRVLKALFSKVAPQIETLSLGKCRGFTVTELVKSTADHLNLLKHCDTRVPY